MRHYEIAILAAAFSGVVALGCSQRKNPSQSNVPIRDSIFLTTPGFVGTLDTLNDRPNALFNAIRPDPSVRRVRVYVPPGYRPRGAGRPFPAIYFLHDFGWDDDYLGVFEFSRLMDRLIADSIVQPMIIVQTDASDFYGGSFYTDSPGTARYFTMIDSLVAYIDRSYNTVFGRRSRAIAGVGMGGYGALKYILTGQDSTFGSVSTLSAPLAFEGTSGTGGFRSPSYRNAFFNESGVTVGDSAGYRAIAPDRLIARLLRTNILFAMGAAFSSLDTTFNGVVDSLPSAQQGSVANYFRVARTTHDAGLLFPIDHNAVIIDSVWQRWQRHDLTTLLATRAGRLDTVPLYFSCGLDDELEFLDQNQAFRTALQNAGFTGVADFTGMSRAQFFRRFYYEEYSGYPGRPADHNTFISDQLAKVFKFHSQFLEPARVP